MVWISLFGQFSIKDIFELFPILWYYKQIVQWTILIGIFVW